MMVKQAKRAARTKIYAIEDGVKSPYSIKMYKWHFDAFKKHTRLSDEKVCQIGNANPRKLESIIIEYLRDHMGKRLKHSTINTAMHAIFHFCDMNDIMNINKRKISKFIPADENHQKDRDYTRKEIEELLKKSDERMRVVVHLMASTGMRIGAIPDLELRDLTEFPPKDSDIIFDTGEYPKPYKIEVYARSKKDGYYTFCTPECAKAINEYLDSRKRHGEDITKMHHPLIREQFDVNSKSDAANPIKVTLFSLSKSIERIVKKAGIRDTHNYSSSPRVMRTNGFRKFAITRMSNAKVDYEVREYLVGHKLSRGLGVNYDRSGDDYRFEEWVKAVNLLTINEEYQVKQQLQHLKDEHERRFFEQDQKIAMLSESLKSVVDERNTERNKVATAIRYALQARHSNVKSGNWTELEAMDFLNRMLTDVDPVQKKRHNTTY